MKVFLQYKSKCNKRYAIRNVGITDLCALRVELQNSPLLILLLLPLDIAEPETLTSTTGKGASWADIFELIDGFRCGTRAATDGRRCLSQVVSCDGIRIILNCVMFLFAVFIALCVVICCV